MTNEINEIIKKNLPAQVGEVLQQRLKKADDDEKMLETAKKTNEDAVKKINELTSEVAKHKAITERESAVTKRELDVKERENSQKVFEAELKLAEAEKRITDIVNLTSLAFKSPVFRKEYTTPMWSSWRNNDGSGSSNGGGIGSEEVKID